MIIGYAFLLVHKKYGIRRCKKKCRNILKHLLDFKGEKVKGKNMYKFDQFPCGNLIFSSNFSNLTCQNQGIYYVLLGPTLQKFITSKSYYISELSQKGLELLSFY